MTKLMTLAEALATGRPFKHKDWTFYSTALDDFRLNSNEWYATEWEIQEEEKPPMRVFASRAVYGSDGESRENHLDLSLGISDESAASLWRCDVTESLAKALAPYIKKELSL